VDDVVVDTVEPSEKSNRISILAEAIIVVQLIKEID
jgi:hypothetical protein